MYSHIYIKVISFLFIFTCNVTRYSYVNEYYVNGYRNNQNTDKYNRNKYNTLMVKSLLLHHRFS